MLRFTHFTANQALETAHFSMRLKKIKLAGFKSFVDPTIISFDADLIGVVGPNGCGKSNVIDAVRWVMGESSAKHLRGDSMADVIFNGSTARKPVGRASVELIFDNSEGRAGGQYASYAEIAVRRETGRDGQSDYFLNKTRCRRKDIVDLFLGTGLGPRNYSVIEQGMVSRIIEAKPEELRVFFEEAAGISKYKERRRETENRIKHTRENMARVNDICSELQTQLGRLERQSKAANRYKILKEEERTCQARHFAWRKRDFEHKLHEQDRLQAARENALQEILAQSRALEADMERLRAAQVEANDHCNTVQGTYYTIGAEIGALEQAIQHARELQQQREHELEQAGQSLAGLREQHEADQAQLQVLKEGMTAIAPRHDRLQDAVHESEELLRVAEEALQEWQTEWMQFTAQAHEPEKVREVQSTRLQDIGSQLEQIEQSRARLLSELENIQKDLQAQTLVTLKQAATTSLTAQNTLQEELSVTDDALKALRTRREETTEFLIEARERFNGQNARLLSLEELQAEAQGATDEAMQDWLKEKGLDKLPRLNDRLSVEAGWERAVERALGFTLTAFCVTSLEEQAQALSDARGKPVALCETGDQSVPSENSKSLSAKINTALDLSPWLEGVYVADDLNDALARRQGLRVHESIMTRAGEWVGKHWMSVGDEGGAGSGLLQRQRQIQQLQEECATAHKKVAHLQQGAAELDVEYADLEEKRTAIAARFTQAQQENARAQERLVREEARVTQLQQRCTQIEHERDELEERLRQNKAARVTAEELLHAAEGNRHQHEEARQSLLRVRDEKQARVDEARRATNQARDELHQCEIERQNAQSLHASLEQADVRMRQQAEQLESRVRDLQCALDESHAPLNEKKARLEDLLARRLEIEEQLRQARQELEACEQKLREQNHAHQRQDKEVQNAREQLEQAKMARQEVAVMLRGLDEQISTAQVDIEAAVAELGEDTTIEELQQQLDKVARRIQNLGPINLAAIHEYEEQSQRKKFLDQQQADLHEALTALEQAIHKIDRETRTRFSETFNRINESFQQFFPRLFGGGSAYLELTEQDLLNTGVTVMARPPGKRNNTIHLLSGGEKALTAVALIFSIFQLNPAPFCLLDEVDAPLDDANVERYCETLKTMAGKSQLIFITHNKITMEYAEVLVGVTMSEPGVSRLVSVDIDEAMKMAVQ